MQPLQVKRNPAVKHIHATWSTNWGGCYELALWAKPACPSLNVEASWSHSAQKHQLFWPAWHSVPYITRCLQRLGMNKQSWKLMSSSDCCTSCLTSAYCTNHTSLQKLPFKWQFHTHFLYLLEAVLFSCHIFQVLLKWAAELSHVLLWNGHLVSYQKKILK